MYVIYYNFYCYSKYYKFHKKKYKANNDLNKNINEDEINMSCDIIEKSIIEYK